MAKKKLLLVGWDSADWKIMHPLLDAGQLPGLERLVNTGVSGNLTTLEPQLSPMLWTSIATGKMAYQHGVLGFTEVDPATGQVVPVSAATRQCRTLWEILGDRGLRSHVVGWFATQGEQGLHGKLVSNLFAHVRGVRRDQDPASWPPPPPGTYWPPELAATLNELRVSPYEVDPDHLIRLFVPNASQVDQKQDPRLWHLTERLAEAFSVHAAATHLLASDPDWDFMAVYYRTIDELSHAFMPYHPPKMAGIPAADFETYQDVVNGAYRLHDIFLQRLVDLAGPDTAVMLVSDHGFHSDHLRPQFTPRVPAGITVWHRSLGALALSGPGIKPDALVYGARLLDITPTILHYFGLPVGRDMEGRILEEAFVERTPPAWIPTWERPEGPPQAGSRLSDGDSQALLDLFVRLGYVAEISSDANVAAAETNRENAWNLARARLYGGRFEEALPLLEECSHARPERTDYLQVLATCQLRLGLLGEADTTISQVLETFGRTEGAQLLKATIAMQRGQPAAALQLLLGVQELNPGEPQLQILLAQSYLSLRRWAEAEAAARRGLAADPQNAEAFLVLARLHLHQRQTQAATDEALEAIGLQYGHASAHYLLGAALCQAGQWDKALHPLRNCLQLAPKSARARLFLARVHRALGEKNEAALCERQAWESLRLDAREKTNRLSAMRQAMAARRAARGEADASRPATVNRVAAPAAGPLDFILVSGLPRSGTSLMMQMLRAGGLPILTDGQRPADEDNPEGYWEWERIKLLPKNPRILEEAHGQVVKVISPLLLHLPRKHRYKIIYMTRPLEQVVASQWAMLDHRGEQPKSEKSHLIEVQREYSRQILATLRRSNRVEILEVDFPALMADAAPVIARLAAFLPGQFLPGPEVSACIKPRLFRHRHSVPP
jgi:predicted AlkP superfamily phosphohydrolase/phosphomutase/tetratricopeptide (TPR) repeat protein